MKKFIHSHKLLTAVLAVMLLCGALVVGVLASDVQVPYDIPSGSILEQLPLYTYEKIILKCFSTTAKTVAGFQEPPPRGSLTSV